MAITRVDRLKSQNYHPFVSLQKPHELMLIYPSEHDLLHEHHSPKAPPKGFKRQYNWKKVAKLSPICEFHAK